MAAFEGLFSDPDMQAKLATALGLGPDEFHTLAHSGGTGAAKTHGYKKITRRILGGKPASAYLSPGQIRFFKTILRALFPGKTTQVDPKDLEIIKDYYSGHHISALSAQGKVTTVMSHKSR